MKVRNEKNKHADTIIRNHCVWSLGAGAIPVVFADIAAVSAVQLDMIKSLCEVYEIDFSATEGKALVSSITSAALARAGAASLVKLVPIAGTIVGSVTGGLMAGTSTYALGMAFKSHLSEGGTFLDFDLERLKKIYRDQFEKGKDQVKEWQEEYTESNEPEEVETATQKSKFSFDSMSKKLKKTLDFGSETSEEEQVETKTAAPIDLKEETVTKAKLQPNQISDKLEELAKLYKRELISEADYEATKARILAEL